MNQLNQTALKENNPQLNSGISVLQPLQQQKTKQVLSQRIINQYKITSINQEFENEFDQNPLQIDQEKLTIQDKPKQTKNSNNIIEPKQGQRQKPQKQKVKLSSKIVETNQIYLANQTFPLQQSPVKNLKVSVLQNKGKQSISNPNDIERKVNEIAKQIRGRIKRQSKQSEKSENNKFQLKKITKEQSANKIQSRDIILSPINKPNSIDFSPSKLLTFQDTPDASNSKTIVKDMMKKQILSKVWNAIEIQQKIKKHKLKLDPIKHKYPITVFRKAILQQDKNLSLQQQKKLKERQQKLLKRRLIYNSSRYDRYIKHSQYKKIVNYNENECIVLLKRQGNGSFLQSMENPQEKNKENEAIGIFPTETQGQTIEVQQQSHRQIPQDGQQDDQYNEDFL